MSAKSQRKKPSSKAKAASRPKDAIGLLRADHHWYKIRAVREGPRRRTETNIGDPHTAIEEEISYPAVREALPKQEGLLDEAKVEHESIASMQSILAHPHIRGFHHGRSLRKSRQGIPVLGASTFEMTKFA